ncbi:MAG TPA: phosphatase PAP2 family protein [Polyangiaceae bacterium]
MAGAVTARPLAHLTSLWPSGGWVLGLPFPLWCASRLVEGEVRWEQIALALVMPALAYTSVRTRNLFVAVLPLALLGLTYDAMRYVEDVGITPARVHVCDLRAIDAALFGRPGWTVHDWFQGHPVAALDLICAVPYGAFLFVTVAFALWLYAHAPREAALRFGWTFFAMSALGFVTYHVYPAAAPWYFHAHGCTVDLATHASAGPNLTRVDQWLGVRYFEGMYGRSNDVFGSVPSLHVAYPMLIALEGWRWMRAPGRVAAVVFAVWMSFAAVYLDHHWIVDLVLGWLYCGAGYAGVSRLIRAATPVPDAVRSSG